MVHAEGRVGAKFKPSRRHAAAHQRIAKEVRPPSLAGSHCDDDVALSNDDVALGNDDVALSNDDVALGATRNSHRRQVGGKMMNHRRGRGQELGPVISTKHGDETVSQ